ncbi:hypothetical protein D9758_004028 [Tetrapyrgos nigripes]|uniref:Uncharacterized protein n=1 Tax=Tetrapyrgos nigripes TaxID=182062 RepID=A0A8H5GLC3_9AGAR|nr:hypothetical protein D9758_004028 [Tetrapyrgos nigripes]
MSTDGSKEKPTKQITLDLGELDENELAFLKSQTGIEDVEVLTRHVEDIARRAHKVFGYDYLTRTLFLKFRSTRLPVYKHVLELGKTRDDALFLDVGCGWIPQVGHDIRKTIADEYPIQNMVGSDLHPEFWDLGHELFKSTPETFPVPFIPGDALDDDFIPNRDPFLDMPTTSKPSRQSLASSKSLASLQGHVSVIHASALFHLFLKESQRRLARKLASLLSPVPGSVIFGVHRGLPQPGEIFNTRSEQIFCHSADSWKRLWIGGEGEVGVFPSDAVDVQAVVIQVALKETWILVWSVKRI